MDEIADKIIVGSEEWCGLPELGIPAIKARVDSGAKTSALHAYNIKGFRRGGRRYVRFDAHPLQGNRRPTIPCEAEVIGRRIVKSSNGVASKRYVIRTPMTLGDRTWTIEVTLANRDSMGYRMLLGREAMRDRVLVDPGVETRLGDKTRRELASIYAGT